MAINENQSKAYRIYIKESKRWVDVNKEFYTNYYREINAFRKRQQEHGRCVCPASKRYLCDMDCLTCPYAKAGDQLSLDNTVSDGDGNEKSWLDDVPDESAAIAEVLEDAELLHALYKDPFSFKPCHTLVLYTNHLPRVSASDDGIWRRLIVIPFNAKITGSSDIKNYSEYLYDNAGGSILAWVIEGAKKVIESDYQIPVPDLVQKAIDEYRSQNDWFGHFLADKCEVDPSYKESSSSLYQAYRNYSLDCNEYVRSTADFYFALEKAGFERITVSRKRYFKGLRLREDTGADEDFMN